jgi:DNA repair exonuclease SbcCD ATPase subunit
MRRWNLLILATGVLFLVSAAVTSCGNKEEEASESTAQQYTQDIETRLDQMEERIQDLEEEIKGKEAEMQATLENELEDLREQRSAAKAKLEDLREKGGETWQQVKVQIDEQIANLEASYEDLKKRVQGS